MTSGTPAGTPGRLAVVAAASRHGSTAEIVGRIGQALRRDLPAGWTVRTSDLTDRRDLAGADALVLGSAVYMGSWLRAAERVLDHPACMPSRATWLFSTGPIAEAEDHAPLPGPVGRAVEAGRAREHRGFGGRLDVALLSRWERLVVRMVGERSSDHRDWAAVDRWAGSIADALRTDVPVRA